MALNLSSPQIKTATSQPVQHHSWAISALVVVAIGLVGWFLVLPAATEYWQRRSLLQQLRADAASLTAQQARLGDLVSELEGAEADLLLLDEALPVDARVTKVHVLIDNLVRSSGMTLANVAVDNIDSVVAAANTTEPADSFSQEKKLHILPVTINLTGSLDQFLPLLQLFEDSSRLLDIDSIDIVPSEDTLLAFRLKLKVYFYSASS